MSSVAKKTPYKTQSNTHSSIVSAVLIARAVPNAEISLILLNARL